MLKSGNDRKRALPQKGIYADEELYYYKNISAAKRRSFQRVFEPYG